LYVGTGVVDFHQVHDFLPVMCLGNPAARPFLAPDAPKAAP
jgi:hypothetical protein